jgi:hypothetical protein
MTVNVSIEELRTAGQYLFEARETLVTDADAHLLHGVGDNVHLSTGGYSFGVACQEILTDLYGRAQHTFGNLLENLTGLSAALFVVADVYETTDLEAEFKFAFAEPGAPVPPNLPPHINPEVTAASMRKTASAQAAAEEGGALPAGWTTRTRHPYLEAGLGHEPGLPSYRVVELYDDQGNLVSTRQEYVYPDGRELTESYDGDGGTEYYTVEYEYDQNGNLTGEKVVDRATVEDQPDAVEPGQGLRWEVDELTRLEEERAWREQDPGHNESEWRETPKTLPA